MEGRQESPKKAGRVLGTLLRGAKVREEPHGHSSEVIKEFLVLPQFQEPVSGTQPGSACLPLPPQEPGLLVK